MTIDVPEELLPKLREGAKLSHVEEGEFVAVAIAQVLSRILKDSYLESRAARATGMGWKAFLDSASDAKPMPGDELPESLRDE